MDILDRAYDLVVDNVTRAYDWVANILIQFWQYLTTPPSPEERARIDTEDAGEEARLREEYRLNPLPGWLWAWANVSAFFVVPALFIILCLAAYDSFFPHSFPMDQPTTALVWTLDTTSPYHVIASLPGEAFTYAQMTKLDIGWEVAPNPAEFDKGGWRGRSVDMTTFYPFQDKLDLHYHDLVAKEWPANRGVGVALGQHAGIVEFVAALHIFQPDTSKRTLSDGRPIVNGGKGTLIEHVAIAPGAPGGDRLSLPRLLKEGWVVIGKEERMETKAAAKRSQGEERPSSSGGYAWDGDNEFEGHEKGGWKSWTPKLRFPLHMLLRYPPNRGNVPVLTLRYRSTGLLLKAFLKGDAWVVNTLVEDNRPSMSRWRRIF